MSGENQMEEHVQELLPAYALGCLEAEEMLQVAAHLRTCGECQDELADYEGVTELLPLAVQEVAPRPSLQERLFRDINALTNEEAPTPDRRAEGRPGFLQRSAPVLGALGLVFLVALAVVNLSLWSRLQDLSAQSTTLQTVALLPEPAVPLATGLMIVGGDGSVGTLVVDHLPLLEEGQQYQLWLIQDGVRDDGGVFSVDEDGYGVRYLHAPAPLLSYSAFGITIEPEGGSPAPTGEKVLGADL